MNLPLFLLLDDHVGLLIHNMLKQNYYPLIHLYQENISLLWQKVHLDFLDVQKDDNNQQLWLVSLYFLYPVPILFHIALHFHNILSQIVLVRLPVLVWLPVLDWFPST